MCNLDGLLLCPLTGRGPSALLPSFLFQEPLNQDGGIILITQAEELQVVYFKAQVQNSLLKRQSFSLSFCFLNRMGEKLPYGGESGTFCAETGAVSAILPLIWTNHAYPSHVTLG